MNIIIIGAHGKVALLAAPLLAQAGHVVRGVIRNPDHSGDVRNAMATPLLSDIEEVDTEGFARLFAGHNVVVWSAGAGGGNPTRTYAVDRDAAIRSIDAAERAGVKRYVMVSYFGAGPDHGVTEGNSFFPYAEAKAAADKHLRESSLDWTILGPSALTLEEPTNRIDFRVVEQGNSDLSGGQVSRANVARVIAAVVEADNTIGSTIEFNDGATPIEEAVTMVQPT